MSADVTDTWLGRAIRDAAAGAARDLRRRVPTPDEVADDRTERFVDAVAEATDNESDD